MPLSCDYDCDDFDYYVDPDNDFSEAQHDCNCNSCKKEIKTGETVLKFTCWRPADPDSENTIDIQADENGEDVYLPDEFHCERCGEIYLNLQILGYVMYSNDYMPGLLRDYWNLTGFDPEKYRVKK